MKGLIQKDICLLKGRMRSIILMVAIGFMLAFSTGGYFVMAYLTMIGAIVTVGTISYDEFDNGYPFLMTLPVTRRDYVKSKFVICIAGGCVAWVIAFALFVISRLVTGGTVLMMDFVAVLVYIPILVFFVVSIMLPLQLKYGAERSRVAMIAVMGGMFAIGYFGIKFIPGMASAGAALAGLSAFGIVTLAFVIGIAALAISYPISVKIMENKDI
ncbi:MAG: ABC-2 transporter permease [Firmicutes bacterium]|nr:ABC-2 transporter permease [Bacillota bacterium]